MNTQTIPPNVSSAEWHKECIRLRGLVMGAELDEKKAPTIAARLEAQRVLRERQKALSAHRMSYGAAKVAA